MHMEVVVERPQVLCISKCFTGLANQISQFPTVVQCGMLVGNLIAECCGDYEWTGKAGCLVSHIFTANKLITYLQWQSPTRGCHVS